MGYYTLFINCNNNLNIKGTYKHGDLPICMCLLYFLPVCFLIFSFIWFVFLKKALVVFMKDQTGDAYKKARICFG